MSRSPPTADAKEQPHQNPGLASGEPVSRMRPGILESVRSVINSSSIEQNSQVFVAQRKLPSPDFLRNEKFMLGNDCPPGTLSAASWKRIEVKRRGFKNVIEPSSFLLIQSRWRLNVGIPPRNSPEQTSLLLVS